MGVIPIVNENDTLAVTEIKFGDNDTLSAITAAMVHADYLFLMTDVDCLYDKNPRTNPDAMAIEVVEDIAALQADGTPHSSPLPQTTVLTIQVSSAGSALGTGGMSTKIVAARLATSAGVTTVITRSSNPGNIANIVSYIQATKSLSSGTDTPPRKAVITPAQSNTPVTAPLDSSTALLDLVAPLHTRFIPSPQPIRDRYFWLLHGLAPHGTVFIDAGARRALSNKAGLLPVGVVDVDGSFAQQEAVRLVVVDRIKAENVKPADNGKLWEGPGVEVGRALVNYSAIEIARIKGMRSSEIEVCLGYADSEYAESIVSLKLGWCLHGGKTKQKMIESTFRWVLDARCANEVCNSKICKVLSILGQKTRPAPPCSS